MVVRQAWRVSSGGQGGLLACGPSGSLAAYAAVGFIAAWIVVAAGCAASYEAPKIEVRRDESGRMASKSVGRDPFWGDPPVRLVPIDLGPAGTKPGTDERDARRVVVPESTGGGRFRVVRTAGATAGNNISGSIATLKELRERVGGPEVAGDTRPAGGSTGRSNGAQALRPRFDTSAGGRHVIANAPADQMAAPRGAGAAGAAGATVVAVPTSMPNGAPSASGPWTARIISNFEGPLQVPVGRSILARLSRPAKRVAVANPDVAEVVIIGPHELLINGKGRTIALKNGESVRREAQTSIVVWDREGRSDMRTLYVNQSRTEQVLLEVIVAEVNRTALERYGVDFGLLEEGNFLLSTPSRVAAAGKDFKASFPAGSGIAKDLSLAENRLTFLYQNLNNDLVVFLEALQQESLAKILARPVVLARSGEEAHLRVGGEVPVVYATANVATVTFKDFGVLLTFTPEFTDGGMIDLRVSMEVSEPTTALATSFGGFEIPSFVGREADTRVLLEPGQTLMIGGLYREKTDENEEKVPYLGDVPLLGRLFRKTVFEVNRTELVMAVKPTVVTGSKGLRLQRLPTDRPPLSRDEVRTLKSNPFGVTRPRPQGASPPQPGRRSIRDYLKRGADN